MATKNSSELSDKQSPFLTEGRHKTTVVLGWEYRIKPSPTLELVLILDGLEGDKLHMG